MGTLIFTEFVTIHGVAQGPAASRRGPQRGTSATEASLAPGEVRMRVASTAFIDDFGAGSAV